MDDTSELLAKHREILADHRAELLEEVDRIDVALAAFAEKPPKPKPKPKARRAENLPTPARGRQIWDALREMPDSMPNDLASHLGMSRTNVSVNLGRMRKRGLVKRTKKGWRVA